MRRPRVPGIALAAAALLVACVGQPTEAPPRVSTAPTTAPSADPTDVPPVSPEVTRSPGSMPIEYQDDVAAQDVPTEALIPVGASPSGGWFAFTDDGVMIVAAWSEPGDDVTRLPGGFAVWRHAASAPFWRAAYVERRPSGVAGIQITTSDVTGDGSDDVLAFEADPAGGTGGCGTWIVVRLPHAERIYRDRMCDAWVEPAKADGMGLVVTESVFRPGDAHCCPSAIRRTVLEWTASSWRVTDRSETPT